MTAETTDAFVSLWHAARVEQGVSAEVAWRFASDGRVANALQRPDVTAYLAQSEGQPVGYVVLTVGCLSLTESPDLAIDQLYVASGFRRHGVARQLLTTVVSYAERSGNERIISNVPAQHRDANRFFARLGFSSVIVRRVTPTAALHRRISGASTSRRVASFEQVRRRRRSVRTEAAAAPPPARSA